MFRHEWFILSRKQFNRFQKKPIKKFAPRNNSMRMTLLEKAYSGCEQDMHYSFVGSFNCQNWQIAFHLQSDWEIQTFHLVYFTTCCCADFCKVFVFVLLLQANKENIDKMLIKVKVMLIFRYFLWLLRYGLQVVRALLYCGVLSRFSSPIVKNRLDLVAQALEKLT